MKQSLKTELYKILVDHDKDGSIKDISFYFKFAKKQPFSVREYRAKTASRKWMEGICKAIMS